VLTAGPGWEWVFFVNVPVGIAIAALVPSVVRADPTPQRTSIDVLGALLVTAATAALIYGLVNAGDNGWTSTGTVLSGLGAVLGFTAFVAVEARRANPLMRPATMARRPVVSGAVLMLVATGLMLGLFFLTSLYFQDRLGFGALKTGLLFLPVAVAITLGAQLGAHLISRVGGRAVVVPALLIIAVGTAALTSVEVGDNVYTAVLPWLTIAAFGIGPVFVTATTTTLANVPHAEAGVASGVVNTAHELGGSIGVAVLSTVAATSIESPDLAGFTNGYLVCAIAAVVAAVLGGALVPAGRPAAMVGHGHGH
jgi:predicted MFS family arabinose efflux permease